MLQTAVVAKTKTEDLKTNTYRDQITIRGIKTGARRFWQETITRSCQIKKIKESSLSSLSFRGFSITLQPTNS